MAPLPAFVITFANGLLFGWVFGAILSWSTAMLGAVICFYLAKFLPTIRLLKRLYLKGP